MTVVLIRAEDSYIVVFLQGPPAEQLSLKLTAAAFAVGITHEQKMNDRMNLSICRRGRTYCSIQAVFTFRYVTLVYDAHLGSISLCLSLMSVC